MRKDEERRLLEEFLKNRAAVPSTNVESHTSNESLGKKETKGLVTPCSIHVHSRRHRLCDTDGISFKYTLDALVLSGLLPDDTPEHIKEITFSQEKIGKNEQEETIIEIQEV